LGVGKHRAGGKQSLWDKIAERGFLLRSRIESVKMGVMY
jgi:hypothetical protein